MQCGSELPANVRFCPSCGNPCEPTAPVINSARVTDGINNAQHKKSPAFVFAIISAIVLIAIVFVFIFRALFSYKIDLNDYVNISCNGYDGYGTATYTIDTDSLSLDFSQHYKLDKKYAKTLGIQASDYLGLKDDVCFASFIKVIGSPSLSQTTDLKNGDSITLSWICSDKTKGAIKHAFGISLDTSDMEYSVTNLRPIELIDPFDNVSFTFSGIQNSENIQLETDLSDDFRYSIEEPLINVTNGDEITLKIYPRAFSSWEEYTENTGRQVASDSVVLKVDGLDILVSSISDIPVSFLNEADKNANRIIAMHIQSSLEENDWAWKDQTNYYQSSIEKPKHIRDYICYSPTEGISKVILLYRIDNRLIYTDQVGNRWADFDVTVPVYLAYEINANLCLSKEGIFEASDVSGELLYNDEEVITISRTDENGYWENNRSFEFDAFINEEDFNNQVLVAKYGLFEIEYQDVE